MKSKISKRLFSFAKSSVGDLIIGLAFEKFSSLIPVRKIKETDKVVAFWHPKPFYEKHILIVPKKRIKNLLSISNSDMEYVDEIYKTVKEVVKKLKWEDGGYTLLTNGGNRQEVNQLHFHLWSGKIVTKK